MVASPHRTPLPALTFQELGWQGLPVAPSLRRLCGAWLLGARRGRRFVQSPWTSADRHGEGRGRMCRGPQAPAFGTLWPPWPCAGCWAQLLGAPGRRPEPAGARPTPPLSGVHTPARLASLRGSFPFRCPADWQTGDLSCSGRWEGTPARTTVSRPGRPGHWPSLLRGQSCLRRLRDLSLPWVLFGANGGG